MQGNVQTVQCFLLPPSLSSSSYTTKHKINPWTLTLMQSLELIQVYYFKCTLCVCVCVIPCSSITCAAALCNHRHKWRHSPYRHHHRCCKHSCTSFQGKQVFTSWGWVFKSAVSGLHGKFILFLFISWLVILSLIYHWILSVMKEDCNWRDFWQ